jgi:hypothetical protein
MPGGAALVRIERGAVCEEVQLVGAGQLCVRYERCPAGWSARFTLADPEVAELAVVHRLVAPSLREARRAVPAAVAFLRGEPMAGG